MNSIPDIASDCPNINNCQIINQEGLVDSLQRKDFYITRYCKAGPGNWMQCSRYMTSQALHLCPDFVLPDSSMSLEEIMNKMEE